MREREERREREGEVRRVRGGEGKGRRGKGSGLRGGEERKEGRRREGRGGERTGREKNPPFKMSAYGPVVSGNIRFLRLIAGFPGDGASNKNGVLLYEHSRKIHSSELNCHSPGGVRDRRKSVIKMSA